MFDLKNADDYQDTNFTYSISKIFTTENDFFFDIKASQGPHSSNNYEHRWVTSGEVENTEFLFQSQSSGAEAYSKEFSLSDRYISFSSVMSFPYKLFAHTREQIKEGNDYGFGQYNVITRSNNQLFFTASDAVHGEELWKTDGTTAGTVLIKDINPDGHSIPFNLNFLGDILYFTADDGTNGYELWYTQNTGATSKSTNAITTALFKNINTIATESSNPTNFIVFDGKMYFTADNGTNGIELWESDGSVGGTKLKQDINPTGDSNPRDFIISNNLLYFSADDGTNGDELWKYSNDFIIGSLSPNDDAIDVALSGENLKITLNKEIVKGTGNITIYKSSDDSVFETINVTSSNVTINSNTAVISPTLNFSAAEDYYVFIDNGALKDGRNNSFSGISDKTIWNFKTVGIQNQAITFNILADKTFGDADFQLTATASSNLAVSYTSSNTNVATINGNTVTIVGAGNTTITASQSGNANYNPASNVAQSLTIDKANQTITFGTLSDVLITNSIVVLTGNSNSGLPISYTSSNTSVGEIIGTNNDRVRVLDVGTINITASQSGNSNYNSAPNITQSLTINKAPDQVTLTLLPSTISFDDTFNYSASVNSGEALTITSSNTNVISNDLTVIGVGTTTITATQPGTNHYLSASDAKMLTVVKANQTIVFNPIPDVGVDDANFNLAATSNSSLPISYVSSNSNVAFINGNVVDILAVGTTTITASQTGNNNYNVATDVSQTLTVSNTANTDDFNKFNFEVFPNPVSSNFEIKTEIKIKSMSQSMANNKSALVETIANNLDLEALQILADSF